MLKEAKKLEGYALHARDGVIGEVKDLAIVRSTWEPTRHLRSVNATKGYHVEALDGAIGHVEDFLIDGEIWRIWYLVIDTRNWWPGKKALVSPAWIQSVRWDTSQVVVDLARDAIKKSPEYDPAAPWNPEYAARLHEHYARPPYPDWDYVKPTAIVEEKDKRGRP